jgi:hypothetical protein
MRVNILFKLPRLRSFLPFGLGVTFCVFSFGFVNLYDEGIVLSGAYRIMLGDIPYRDFWSMYPPGSFYINAGLLSLFGEQIFWTRLFDALVRVTIVFVSYKIYGLYLSRRLSVILALICYLILIYVGFASFSVFPATLIALVVVRMMILAAPQMVRAMSGEQSSVREVSKFVFIAGLLTGIEVSFRHDLAAYTFVSVIVFLVTPLFVRWRKKNTGASSWRFVITNCIRYTLGTAVTFLPLAVSLLVYAGFDDVYFSLIDSPSKMYPAQRELPFPSFGLHTLVSPLSERNTLLIYFPYALVSIAALTLFVKRLSCSSKELGLSVELQQKFRYGVVAMVLTMTGLFTLKGLVRTHTIHLAPAILVALVLVAQLYWLVGSHWSRRLITGGIALVFFIPTLIAIPRALGRLPDFIAACKQPAHSRSWCVPFDAETAQIAHYVDEEYPDVEYVYVGASRHDKIFVGNLASYFVFQRKPLSKWHEIHPGLQTRDDIQQEIVSQIKASESVLVFKDRRWDGVEEPNLSGRTSGNVTLDQYIEQCFSEVQRSENLSVYALKEICSKE